MKHSLGASYYQRVEEVKVWKQVEKDHIQGISSFPKCSANGWKNSRMETSRLVKMLTI